MPISIGSIYRGGVGNDTPRTFHINDETLIGIDTLSLEQFGQQQNSLLERPEVRTRGVVVCTCRSLDLLRSYSMSDPSV